MSLGNLGAAATARGEHAAAQELLQESLALQRELGDKEGLAECLERLAGVASVRAQPTRAARLFGAVEALRDALGAPWAPSLREVYTRSLAAARADLGEDVFVAALADGRAMTVDQAVEYGLTVEDDARATPA
jgi:hypothetical protein